MSTPPHPPTGADGAGPRGRDDHMAPAVRAGWAGPGRRLDGDADRDARLAALTASLAARLRPACRHWDAATFEAFVARVARTELRWAERDGHA